MTSSVICSSWRGLPNRYFPLSPTFLPLATAGMAPLWILVALGYLLLYAFASMQTQGIDLLSYRFTD